MTRRAPAARITAPGVAVVRPSGHRDATADATDADELAGSTLVIRGEHGAERRNDAVEALVCERQILRVAFDPLDVDPRLGRTTPGVLEELRREIQADDLRAATRSRNCDVASCARADVQQVETRTKVDALEDNRTHRLNQPRVGVPVTGRPRRPYQLRRGRSGAEDLPSQRGVRRGE